MTETLKKYRIFSEEDFQRIDFNEYSSVEIYAKNTSFDCTEINVTCCFAVRDAFFQILRK